MSHDLLVRGSGWASFAHYTLRSGTFNHAVGSHHRAHSKMRTLSATVAPMKSLDDEGVDESLPSKVRRPLPGRRAQVSEKRTAAF